MPLIEKLPLFPLGVVLYPNERLPLHIFEPRYKAMVQHCMETDRRFGMVYANEGKMAGVGCTARIDRIVKKYEDGRLDMFIAGETRFLVKSVYQEQAFLTADVELVVEPQAPIDRDLKERAITQHMRLLELAGRMLRPSVYQGKRDVSYVLAHNAGLTSEQKQELLEIVTENDRIVYLVRHFEGLIPRVEQREDLRRKIQSNGHIRDFPLRDEPESDS
jgi:ATP-dependent Lon protease